MLQNKGLGWLIAVIYAVLFIWMWTHSQNPTISDVPILLDAGMIVSLLCLIPFGRKANKALMILNIVLVIANIVMFFAAYRLVTGALKT